MGKTLKSLIQEHHEMVQRLRVLDEIKVFLERCQTPYSGEPVHRIKNENGSPIDNEVILNELSEIDDTIASTQRRIEELERMEFSDGRESKDSNAGKSAVGAGSTVEKNSSDRKRAKRPPKSSDSNDSGERGSAVGESGDAK